MQKLALSGIVLLAAGIAGCANPHATIDDGAPIIRSDENAVLLGKMQAWAEDKQFNGVMAVGQAGKAVVVLKRGFADQANTRLLTVNSVFQTGSVDKFFASIAAFAMAEKGLLDLDAPIAIYLPEYRKDIAAKVTIAHLMSNRSGITDKPLRPVMGNLPGLLKANPGAKIEDLPGMNLTIDQAIDQYFSEDLMFEPGSQFDYANSNWVILHNILEKVAKKPYAEILQQYVFVPAGMAHSGTFVGGLENIIDREPDAAIGYNKNSPHHDGDYPLPRFIGGGSYTNVADMIALMDALYHGKLISNDSLVRFSSVQTPEEDYAYGGRVVSKRDDPTKLYSWQSGSNGATNMVTVYNINTGFSYAAFSNRAQSQSPMFDLAVELDAIPTG